MDALNKAVIPGGSSVSKAVATEKKSARADEARAPGDRFAIRV